MFNMMTWGEQPDGSKPPADAFKSEGDCGTTVCIAGLAALIDPKVLKLKADRITSYEYTLTFTDSEGVLFNGDYAFAEWLEISHEDAYRLTNPSASLWEDARSDDIEYAIELLTAYRDGEMDAAKDVALHHAY